MLPRNHPDRIQIAFDDHRLVANAGLILPATLALGLGLPQLLRKHLDLGGAPGRANTGDKMMTLVASALAGARFSSGSLRHLQLSRLRHRPGRGDAGTGGRSSPSRRDRECDTRPQVRRGAEPSPLGPLRRQRRLAGGTGDGAQPGPLDSPHRPGSADRDHQDPQTTGLCLGRTDHPLGTPIDPESSPAPALGGAVQPRPGPTASHSTPSLTAPVRH